MSTKLIFTVRTPGTLWAFLVEKLPGWKKTTIRQYLKNGAVKINGREAYVSHEPLSPGDKVAVAGEKSTALREPGMGLTVIHEDADVLVVEKPEGLLSVGTDKEKRKTAYYAISEYLKSSSKANKVFIVHRLDREASGLMVFAKSEDAKYRLQENWDEAEKNYHAVVDGGPSEKSGTIDSILTEVGPSKVVSDVDSFRSKRAVTHYRVIRTGKFCSLVELSLETGRKHQIRVHLSDLGCPIVGDDKYRGSDAERLMLHASSLAFLHPRTAEPMRFSSPFPPIFSKLLRSS
jgi:23S rRNA pseudouridine1911/1915/1917 synthase